IFSSRSAFALNTKGITEDVNSGDKEFSSTYLPFMFQVKGNNLYGFVYMAEGKGPHPTALVLHGFPGNEKSLDLAQALRRGGLNAAFFTYRGAWGSEGNFSYRNCIEDTMTAIDSLKKPENAQKFRIDTENLIVIGHSMGGFIAMNMAKLRQDIRACAYLSGWNAGYVGKRLSGAGREAQEQFKQTIAVSATPLKGTSADLLVEEIFSMKDSHNLVDYVPELKGKKFLLVAGKRDTVCPPEYNHQPLYDALKKAYPNDVSELVLDADHSYSSARMAMIRGVFQWLQSAGY
ncbi:MAG: lysophospholipase, partial [Synergistaceae bacterium]|nr:lysophospholipase [Synergistaceae bacterium]